MPKHVRRTSAIAAGLALVAMLVAPVSSAADLLPAHEAFMLSARALDSRTLEARFNIADGYYLYRDRLNFKVGAANPVAAKAELPRGKMKHDEFFGDSETYRGLVVARIALLDAEAGRKLTLVTESQGCADAGVCYPPQRQTLTLDVPEAGAGPSAFVEAPIGRPAWMK